MRALAPGVRVVTPGDLVLLLRLRLRPRQTLGAALNDLDARITAMRGGRAQASTSRAARLLARHCAAAARGELAAGDYRACFENGRRAYRTLIGGSHP
jgi:phage gp36-like protein